MDGNTWARLNRSVSELVPTVVEVMGGAFPELKRSPQRVIDIVRDEEESFLRTLDRGLKLFNDAAGRVREKRRRDAKRRRCIQIA